LTSGTTAGNTANDLGTGGDRGAGDDISADSCSNRAESTGGHTGAGNDETDNTGGDSSVGSCGANDAGGGEFAGDGSGAGTASGPFSGIRAQVLVTVPVCSLMGLTDEPAVLDGHGPIPPSMARRLVADGAASFYRVLVDPRDGAPLEIGRTNYRVSKAMRQWLRLRDGKCPFPGCNNPSLDNEADHILAWDKGGSTGISNLGQPCPKHHKLRHTSGWKPTPASTTEPPGWISPTGRHYKSEHQDWEPPHWPDQAVPESIRAFDDLLDQWEPPDDLAGVPIPREDLSEVSPPPEEPPFPHELFQDEIPEETFADWFLSGDSPPNDPLSPLLTQPCRPATWG
ncbi:DUF222 domain-containing protein, partial [Pseudarthrobacter sp. fls2-241-R2A-168]|uniref:DUF222 domain-containing protein n=1 Tax=Pseudarthrobacter sp. fls2-241-R2A-168 TaxID=3040304 RepID=UPI00255481A8